MEKKFEINGKTYKAKVLTYNMVCDLEDYGISLDALATKQNAFLRGYLACVGKMSIEQAGLEIEAHIVSGGDPEELIGCLSYAIEESDFFRSLTEKKEKKTPKNQK